MCPGTLDCRPYGSKYRYSYCGITVLRNILWVTSCYVTTGELMLAVDTASTRAKQPSLIQTLGNNNNALCP